MKTTANRAGAVLVLLSALSGAMLPQGAARAASCAFDREFAPVEGPVRPCERPFREAVCLSGRWQFQPVPVPEAFLSARPSLSGQVGLLAAKGIIREG